MPPKIDETIQEERQAAFTPEYRLWLAVTKDAVTCLLNGWNSQAARDYLLDEENPFFDFVCVNIGVEPEAAREHIKQTLARRYQGPQDKTLAPGQGDGPGRINALPRMK